ncbi:hypothetical protein DLM86_07245 [Paenibacillus flagellatus]|uniref:HD domain-containing protein n=1 Tax=Paenibacillus flagellatus TaxID=2211139 RepID=A0A2V5KKY1_9BACL|nr:hypothetical protein DLM86_07245 [Paenibacillus flagellatus]
MVPNDQANQLMDIWNEYEEAETPEARFAQVEKLRTVLPS